MTNITLLITAGTGPKECEYAARGITQAYAYEASQDGLSALILASENPGSHLLRLSGDRLDPFLQHRCGTVQWICKSPFRKNHRRKNWFLGVFCLPEPNQIAGLDSKDITFTATRASGPGGQHVNKTNSSVRATHRPTGIVVTAEEERSQHANKKLCLVKLAAYFAREEELQRATELKSIWKNHKILERGNPVRVYIGEKFDLATKK